MTGNADGREHELIDLATVIAEQSDLAALCSEKPFRTPEIYTPNDNYGQARILKMYSGYRLDRPLGAVVPHGVTYEDDRVFPGEAYAPLPAVLSYPDYVDEAFRRHSNKMVIPSASPFLYALDLLGRPDPPERSGTLFCPDHSTAAVDVDTDWWRLAWQLGKLDEVFKPVTVCMHWCDIERGRHKQFLKRGFPVVSAGHLYDPDFLFRLVHLFSMHRYAAGNNVMTNLFCGIAAGVPYFLLGDEVSVRVDPGEPHPEVYKPTPDGLARMSEVRKLFSKPRTEITDEQRQCADRFLGVERFRAPEGLLADLEKAWSLMPATRGLSNSA